MSISFADEVSAWSSSSTVVQGLGYASDKFFGTTEILFSSTVSVSSHVYDTYLFYSNTYSLVGNMFVSALPIFADVPFYVYYPSLKCITDAVTVDFSSSSRSWSYTLNQDLNEPFLGLFVLFVAKDTDLVFATPLAAKNFPFPLYKGDILSIDFNWESFDGPYGFYSASDIYSVFSDFVSTFNNVYMGPFQSLLPTFQGLANQYFSVTASGSFIEDHGDIAHKVVQSGVMLSFTTPTATYNLCGQAQFTGLSGSNYLVSGSVFALGMSFDTL